MKKISIFVTILAVVMIASAAFAQAVIPAPAKNDRVAVLEEMTKVEENGQVVASDKRTTKLVIPNVAASGEADAAVKRLEGKLYGTKKKPGGTFGDLSTQMDAATNAAKSAASESNAVARELAKVPGALQNQTAAINANTDAVKKVDSSSFWRTIWIILAIVIAGLIMGLLLRRNRREDAECRRQDAERHQQETTDRQTIITTLNSVSEGVNVAGAAAERAETVAGEALSEIQSFRKEAMGILRAEPYSYRLSVDGKTFERDVSVVDDGRGGKWISLYVRRGTVEQQAFGGKDDVAKSDAGAMREYLRALKGIEAIGGDEQKYFNSLPTEKATDAAVRFRMIQKEFSEGRLRRV